METRTSSDPEALVCRLVALQHDVEWTDEQLVDPEESAAYGRLHGYDDTAFVDTAPVGYGAALTFRAILAVLHDGRLALPFDRNLHAAQEMEWLAPLRIGTTLRTRVHIDSVRAASRAVFFDVVSESTDNQGQVCLRGRATQAVRHG